MSPMRAMSNSSNLPGIGGYINPQGPGSKKRLILDIEDAITTNKPGDEKKEVINPAENPLKHQIVSNQTELFKVEIKPSVHEIKPNKHKKK